MATLKDVQNVELEMMMSLDKICRENHISYSMIGGTMLGAIRHRGFIPWDDDIDVYMSIEDFNKLKAVFKSDKLFLQTPETDIQMPYLMYKLRKNNTLMEEERYKDLNMHKGIWLDIFTYCYFSNNRFGQKMQMLLRDILQSYRCRFLHVKNNVKPANRILVKLPFKSQLWIDECIQSLIVKLGNKKSNMYFALDVSNHTIHKCKFFDNLKEYQFEKERFFGVEDYDEYLKSIYGDYMTPRQWNHIGDYSNVIV